MSVTITVEKLRENIMKRDETIMYLPCVMFIDSTMMNLTFGEEGDGIRLVIWVAVAGGGLRVGNGTFMTVRFIRTHSWSPKSLILSH